MEKTINLELTQEEYQLVAAGIALVHRGLFKTEYESMVGNLEGKEVMTIGEFDEKHKIIMNLYDKFDKAKKTFEEEK